MTASLFKGLDRMDRVLGKAEMFFCCLMLILMVAVVAVGVFLRYVMQNPMIAGMNLATLFLVWMSFFAASVIYRDKGHIAMEFVVQRMAPGLRRVVMASVYAVIALSLLVTVIHTVLLCVVQWQMEIVALGIPRTAISLPVVISGILMFMTSIRHLLGELAADGRAEA